MQTKITNWAELLDTFERTEPEQVQPQPKPKFYKASIIKEPEQPKPQPKKVKVIKNKKGTAINIYNFNMLYIDKTTNKSYNK